MIKKFTLLLLFVVAFSWQGIAQITIGTGTEKKSVPINPYFGYSYSQSIYLASEINTSGDITELSFQFNGNSTIANSTDWVVYIGHTTKTEFASNTDWVLAADMTEVFNGTITVQGNGSDEWVTIDITDFTYNGTDNLVIAVDENTSGYDSGSDDFYATAVTGNRSLYKISDSVNSDPAAPVAGTTQAYIANVILGGLTPSNPPNCDATLTTTTNASFTDIAWSAATGAPVGYYLTVGTTSGYSDILDNEDVGNVTSYTFDTPLATGTMYYVTITPYNAIGNATSCTEQNFTTMTPPSNDECSGATVLTVNSDLNCGTVTSGTVEFATASSTDATACYGTENDDVWFKFQATATSHQIKLLNVSESTDMFNSVWEGTCGALTLVTGSCSDPNTNTVSGLTVDNFYFVRVNTYGSAATDTSFDICVGTLPPPPANDACADATEVDTLPYNESVDATGATNNDGFITACSNGMNDGIWYTFTVETAGTITITATPTGWDNEIGVYTGSCGAFTCVDRVDEGLYGELETYNLTAEAGTQYWVNIGHYSSTTDNSEGLVDVSITTTDATLVTLATQDTQIIAGFAYYPNPVNNQLSLRANNTIDQVEVLNILGQTVLTAKPSATSTAIDMTALSQGTYFVRVQANGAIQTVKVIKN